ncbi:O-antigen ligase family protein [Glutamicibacter arilaitensis]|uniref:Ligase n=1 Tax=Glutamicibacter arilaitensis TaxID=256701 RepID=A0A2N7S4Z3_9MICC|nr:O-antigen ligase family protein [Glutamicibacter arilaitensis]PMQ21194.1 ligase [Glutamicibacter arilaitensis]
MTQLGHQRSGSAPAGPAAGQGQLQAPAAPDGHQLPSWPIFALFAGFPVWWFLGMIPVLPVMLSAVMTFYLLNSRRLLFLPGMAPWFLFTLWVGAAVVNVHGAGDLAGFAMRAMDIVLAAVSMLYVANAGASLPKERIINYLMVVWIAIVGLGFLALAIPEARLTTPLGMLLPGSLTSNELVRNLVTPPLAEVQMPWGAPEPFYRPAAPFPYANSWGAAFAMLVPVVICKMLTMRGRLTRALLGLLLALSFIPAVATSNRGMLIGLAVAASYALFRHMGLGHWKLAGGILAAGAVLGIALAASGAISAILGRQEFSDSTGGRMALYEQTWEQSLRAPLLGHGSPQIDPTIGVALGSQGFLWTLMFCYGFVGLALFLYFFAGGILRTWRLSAPGDVWLHAAVIGGISLIPFYGLSVLQMSVLTMLLAVLLRQRYVDAHG